MTAAAAMTLAAPSAAAQDGFYSDMLEDSYYHAPVRALAASGVFDGTDCPGGMFCPSGPIDRATAAVWITRALGEAPADDDPLEFRYRGELAETRPGPQTFTDVDHGLWTAPYIYKLARLGITAGCHREEARFCPDNTVPRGEMASFLRRAFNLPEADPAGFEDLHEGNVHIESIDRLFAAGITAGCSSERFEFCPHMQVTRSQMAAFCIGASHGAPPTPPKTSPTTLQKSQTTEAATATTEAAAAAAAPTAAAAGLLRLCGLRSAPPVAWRPPTTVSARPSCGRPPTAAPIW